MAVLQSVVLGELGEGSGDGKGRRLKVRQEKMEKEGQTGWGEGRDVTKGGSKETKTHTIPRRREWEYRRETENLLWQWRT